LPAEGATSITIGHAAKPAAAGEIDAPGESAASLGRAVAGILRHLVAVLDREDRLESGTGEWLAELRAGTDDQRLAVREGVLRALRLAADGTNYRILETLARAESVTRAVLADRLGLPELSVSERVGDLVSAGLAVKISEANQIAGTPAGLALVEWVRTAVAAGAKALGADLR